MLGDGIHSISAQGEKPLLHLHFYERSFENQGERAEYDLEKGIAERFMMEDLDYIEDARRGYQHPGDAIVLLPSVGFRRRSDEGGYLRGRSRT